jgi:hypothetical protein
MNFKSPLLLVAILWLATTFTSHAAGISFGAWRWSTDYDANTLNIKVDSISNNRSSGYTGTLRIEIWVTNSPIGDAAFKGWKIGEYKTPKLNAGAKRSGINMTVPLLKRPPAGAKYVTMMITEFKEGAGYVRQAKSSSTPHTFK